MPPVAFAVAVPLLPPKQPTFVVDKLMDIADGSVIAGLVVAND